MTPKDLLINTLVFLWNLINEHNYLFFILGVAVIVGIGKLIKATFKTLIKGVLIAAAIFILLPLLGNIIGG